jgi:hypothetical protein
MIMLLEPNCRKKIMHWLRLRLRLMKKMMKKGVTAWAGNCYHGVIYMVGFDPLCTAVTFTVMLT